MSDPNQYVVMGIPYRVGSPHFPVAACESPEEAGAFTVRALRSAMNNGNGYWQALYIVPVERVEALVKAP